LTAENNFPFLAFIWMLTLLPLRLCRPGWCAAAPSPPPPSYAPAALLVFSWVRIWLLQSFQLSRKA